jgi:hypothetical protein
MPRFFLHYCEGESLYPDVAGTEFPNLDQARVQAVRWANDMLMECLSVRGTNERHYEIADESGAVAAIVRFNETASVVFGTPAPRPLPKSPRAPIGRSQSRWRRTLWELGF